MENMEHIDAALTELTDEKLARLIRKSELGADFHFESVVGRLRAIREILVAYREGFDPMQLPSALHPTTLGQAASILPILDEMRTFSPGAIDTSPRVAREDIENRIEAIRDYMVATVKPQLRAPAIASATATAELSDTVDKARVSSAEIERLLNVAKGQAGESASGKASTFHNNRVTQYGKQARYYLFAGAASAAALGALGIWFFALAPPETSGAASDWKPFIADMVVRLFFLGLVSYVLAFCARNFRVSRHLQVTHEQRRVALDTYPMLVEAVYDGDDVGGGADVRNIITAEIARAAFSPIETGFLQEERERTVVETQPSMVAALTALKR